MAEMTFTPEQVDVMAESEGRLIKGLILPYNKVGRTSRGPVSVERGGVTWPVELKRVKLLDGHRKADGTAIAVGYLLNIEETEDGIVATFKVGTSDTAQRALDNALEGIVDAMSVELDNLQFSPDGKRILSSTLSAVALVPIPAFNDARISEVVAQEVADGATAHEEEEMDKEVTGAEKPAEVTAAEVKHPTEIIEPRPASAPEGLPVAFGGKTSEVSFQEACTALQRFAAGERSAELTAALANITNTANIHVAPRGWVGELWSGVAYDRRVVNLLNRAALTSWRVTGWRWTTKPAVAAYSGDKAEIPTNSAATESVDVSASRLAGGHDIDRKFFDFNDSEFIASYFRAMAESYAYESDEAAAAFLDANATVIYDDAPTNTVEHTEPDLLRAVAYGAHQVNVLSRAKATFALVNPADMLSLLDYTTDTVPAFLGLLGIKPENFVTSEHVAPGEVIVGSKSAVTFYELPGSPIRVQAEHLSHGGRDAAVFGYYAVLLHDARGLVKVSIGTPAP